MIDDPKARTDDVIVTTDGDHGPIEVRRAVDDIVLLAESHRFPGLRPWPRSA